jgi:hypothetical protein
MAAHRRGAAVPRVLLLFLLAAAMLALLPAAGGATKTSSSPPRSGKKPQAPNQPSAAAAPAALFFQAAFSGDAGILRQVLERGLVDANLRTPEAAGSKSALVVLLEGAHAAFDRGWPAYAPDGHREGLQVLLRHGADPAGDCPTLEAVTYRNVFALTMLLRAMNASAARACAAARDGRGGNLLHSASYSPAAGLARGFFRAARLEPRDPARGVLEREVAVSIPAFSASGELTRATIERAAGTPDVEAIVAAVDAGGAEGKEEAWAEILSERNLEGLTPLLLACREGRAGVVRRLLDLGADPLAAWQKPPTPGKEAGQEEEKEEEEKEEKVAKQQQ